jgi:hypothetical protein
MWLVSDLSAADIDDPEPGTIIAGRIELDGLAEPFKFGALLVMQVLEPDAPVAARSTEAARPLSFPQAGSQSHRPVPASAFSARPRPATAQPLHELCTAIPGLAKLAQAASPGALLILLIHLVHFRCLGGAGMLFARSVRGNERSARHCTV